MRARVLVVDDDPLSPRCWASCCGGEGFDPAFVGDGGKAVQAYRDLKPDIVLLDLMLPGMSGIDVCRAIGWSPAYPSYVDRQERHRRRRAGPGVRRR